MNDTRAKPPVPVTADRLAEIRARAESPLKQFGGESLTVQLGADALWLLAEIERLQQIEIAAREVERADREDGYPVSRDPQEVWQAVNALRAALSGGGEAA